MGRQGVERAGTYAAAYHRRTAFQHLDEAPVVAALAGFAVANGPREHLSVFHLQYDEGGAMGQMVANGGSIGCGNGNAGNHKYLDPV